MMPELLKAVKAIRRGSSAVYSVEDVFAFCYRII
jgi:hypothetical protein